MDCGDQWLTNVARADVNYAVDESGCTALHHVIWTSEVTEHMSSVSSMGNYMTEVCRLTFACDEDVNVLSDGGTFYTVTRGLPL